MHDTYTALFKRSQGIVWQAINAFCIPSLLGVFTSLLGAMNASPSAGKFLAGALVAASISLSTRLWYSSRFFLPLEHFAKFRWKTAAGAVGRVVGISNGGSHLQLAFPGGVTATYALEHLVREETI